MRLGLLTSHPIQYHTPWFRALAAAADLEVYFAHRQTAAEQVDFNRAFEWDVDLLSGYAHHYLHNVASRPSVNRFSGCDTPELAGILARGRFDAFIVTGWYLKSYWQAVRAGRRARVPVLVRGDSQLRMPASRMKRWWKELTHRWLVRQFAGFLVVGQRNREYLEHYGVPAERLFPVPHCVDNEWFAARAQAARAQRAERRAGWGADERTTVALFVGKFTPKKRPLDLLRAVHEGRRRNPEARWLAALVGSGELEQELRAEAARLNVPVHFLGFKNQTELPPVYAAADVLVLPSDGGETWGLVVNEAMACGLPAIVSDAVGCAPDLVTPEQTGYVFPLGEVAQLADRLGQCAERVQRGESFSAALAARLRDYSVPAAVAGTLAAVRSVRA